MRPQMIAPCGMNCALCLANLRDKNRCEGCRSGDEGKPAYCIKCVIINCTQRTEPDYCFTCGNYPCARLKALDKRYRTKYQMSMLENLKQIRDEGMDAFLKEQEKRWACPACGSLICVHRGYCLKCSKKP